MSELTAARPTPPTRSAFRHFRRLTTRWRDNDAYGHVNNVVFYEWFDTAVNAWLIERGALDLRTSPVVGFVVDTQCTYFAPLMYPDDVEIGLAVSRVGRSSLHYALGAFAVDAPAAAAAARFVHVYVHRDSQRPVAVPAAVLQAIAALVTESPAHDG